VLRKGNSDLYSQWSRTVDRSEEIIEAYQAKGVTPYKHQIELTQQILDVHWFIAAAEMGLGKTLAAAVAIELFFKDLSLVPQPTNCWWVGPKSALAAAEVEFRTRNIKINPKIMTYNAIVSTIANWSSGDLAPNVIVLDESSRCKTPKTQRTEATEHLTTAMRSEHGWKNTLIILLSGDPAPKAPSDWFAQTEIAAPGFLSEASIFELQNRLAFIEQGESPTGNYRKIKTWRDNENKCHVCGDVLEKHLYGSDHQFKASVNEVAKLGNRLHGLVRVWKKKDCLDLPAKRFFLHRLEPTTDMLNWAKTIVKTETRGVDAMIKLRTLSDGFLYKDVPSGELIVCPGCFGRGMVQDHEGQAKCATCTGTGKIDKTMRVTEEVDTPKTDLLTEVLEQHEECGRLVILAAFTGSIEKIIRHCHKKGWDTFRADGKAWEIMDRSGMIVDSEPASCLERFQAGNGRLVFIGNPGSA
jgi:hypothetical protein